MYMTAFDGQSVIDYNCEGKEEHKKKKIQREKEKDDELAVQTRVRSHVFNSLLFALLSICSMR